MRAVNALARLHFSAGLSEPMVLIYGISTWLAHLVNLNKKNSEEGGVTPAKVKVRIVV